MTVTNYCTCCSTCPAALRLSWETPASMQCPKAHHGTPCPLIPPAWRTPRYGAGEGQCAACCMLWQESLWPSRSSTSDHQCCLVPIIQGCIPSVFLCLLLSSSVSLCLPLSYFVSLCSPFVSFCLCCSPLPQPPLRPLPHRHPAPPRLGHGHWADGGRGGVGGGAHGLGA